MVSFDALVRGRVVYEDSDKSLKRVPPGRCTVEAFEGFVGLSWSEGSFQRTAVLTAQTFASCLDAGAILIVDSAQLMARTNTGRREPQT